MKKIVISNQGFTVCPACLAHITAEAELAQTACPFCGENLVAARRASEEVFGSGVMRRCLRTSKSSMLAAALGASLTMAACKSSPATSEGETPSSDMGANTNDAGAIQVAPEDVPEAIYGAPPMDGDEELEPVPAPDAPSGEIYGGPPSDDDEKPRPSEPEDMSTTIRINRSPAPAVYGAPPVEDPTPGPSGIDPQKEP